MIPALAVETGELPEELALGVAMLTGIVLLALWLLNAGSMVRFISKSVLVGFLAGLGIEILTSQVEKILNIRVDTGGWLTDVAEIIKSLPEASLASVAVGVSTIVILRLTSRYTPKLPGPLVALVLVGGAVYVLEPGGVSVLGEVPSGLPNLSFPNLDLGTWSDLLGVSVAIAALSIAEGLLVASSAARRHDDPLDPNGEVVALGIANVAGAVTSGCPSARAPLGARRPRGQGAVPRCRRSSARSSSWPSPCGSPTWWPRSRPPRWRGSSRTPSSP